MAIDLILERLHNQRLAGLAVPPSGVVPPRSDQKGGARGSEGQRRRPAARQQAAAVVSWLGAVQAQDYAGAKWALGQRTTAVTDADVEEAFTRGDIIRTHVLRPTWHFVSPADLRWMLALTAPRVNAVSAYYHRKLELDAGVFARSQRTLEGALQGGHELTRLELAAALGRAGIRAEGLRLGYLMMHAELDQVICSGARRGRQFTYALVEERVPRGRTLPRAESLPELTRRYFASHGPATLRDFVWWSGLTVRDAKAGIEASRPSLVHDRFQDHTYWFQPAERPRRPRAACTYLLPNYDEFLIAYKDRGPALHAGGRDAFAHHLVLDGRLAGSWRRTIQKGSLVIEVALYARPTPSQQQSIVSACERLGKFMMMPVEARVRMST